MIFFTMVDPDQVTALISAEKKQILSKAEKREQRMRREKKLLIRNNKLGLRQL